MAAARPGAVVMSASEMPGATNARLAEPVRPISSNAFMIPQTVPKRPMKGVTLAVVARKLTRRSSRVASTVAARASARESESRLLTVGRAVGATLPCEPPRTCWFTSRYPAWNTPTSGLALSCRQTELTAQTATIAWGLSNVFGHHGLKGPRDGPFLASRCRIIIYRAARDVLSCPARPASMLKLLRINNIAIIAELELELGSGLSLLTGETGAGKSILIDALGLLFGARASAELIRTGEERAVVEAVFESAGAARAVEAHGLPVDGEEIVLRREVHSSGKGKATVNGALVPVSVLRELAPWLAAIHGQHEPQGLLDPETHITVLDRHAGLALDAEALAGPFRRLREVEAELEALRRDRREAERRREMLDYQATEIEKAGLAAGEEEALRQEKQIQASAGRLAELSSDAYRLLYDDEG